MKAILFTDLHAHAYKNVGEPQDRLQNCLRVIKELFAFADANKINVIMFGGDLYDTQKAILTEVVNEMIATFTEVFENYPSITLYAISGNHDHSSKNLIDKPAVTALTHLDTVFPRFILMDNRIVGLSDDVVLAGIPYYEYKEHYQKVLEVMTDRVVSAKAVQEEQGFIPKAHLLIHQTPKGLGNIMIPYDTDPTDPLYDTYDNIYCGHIHGRKEITDKFTLLGTPLHRDSGDAGLKKGFYVTNLAKPEKGKIFIPLEGYPEFRVHKEGEKISEEESQSNYVIIEPDYSLVAETSTANVEEFNTSLANTDLLTNYWKNVDGKDEELLGLGLSFIQK